MADYPALPLFTDAFIADTVHLSAEETGAYLMLLMCAWRTPGCVLPDDDVRLAKFARMTPRRWRSVRDVVMSFWTLTDEGWEQKRLKKERVFVNRQRTLQSEKGKLGGRPKLLKDNEQEKAAALPRLKPDESRTKAPTPTPTPSKSSVSKDTGASAPIEDPRKALWSAAIGLLGEAGVVEKTARSLIGRWIRDNGEGLVFEALSTAIAQRPADPVQWITGSLRHKRGGTPPRPGQPRQTDITGTAAEMRRRYGGNEA